MRTLQKPCKTLRKWSADLLIGEMGGTNLPIGRSALQGLRTGIHAPGHFDSL